MVFDRDLPRNTDVWALCDIYRDDVYGPSRRDARKPNRLLIVSGTHGLLYSPNGFQDDLNADTYNVIFDFSVDNGAWAHDIATVPVYLLSLVPTSIDFVFPPFASGFSSIKER